MAQHTGQLPTIQIGDIGPNKSGGRSAPITTNGQAVKLTLSKQPVLTTPFAPSAYDGGVRVSLDIRLTSELEKLADEIDAAVLAHVKKNAATYWKKPPKDPEKWSQPVRFGWSFEGRLPPRCHLPIKAFEYEPGRISGKVVSDNGKVTPALPTPVRNPYRPVK